MQKGDITCVELYCTQNMISSTVCLSWDFSHSSAESRPNDLHNLYLLESRFYCIWFFFHYYLVSWINWKIQTWNSLKIRSVRLKNLSEIMHDWWVWTRLKSSIIFSNKLCWFQKLTLRWQDYSVRNWFKNICYSMDTILSTHRFCFNFKSKNKHFVKNTFIV